MRDIDLIQDYNGVLHVLVHKIHLEVGAIGVPPRAPLEWKVD